MLHFFKNWNKPVVNDDALCPWYFINRMDNLCSCNVHQKTKTYLILVDKTCVVHGDTVDAESQKSDNGFETVSVFSST